jgi:hypothetical protein
MSSVGQLLPPNAVLLRDIRAGRKVDHIRDKRESFDRVRECKKWTGTVYPQKLIGLSDVVASIRLIVFPRIIS